MGEIRARLSEPALRPEEWADRETLLFHAMCYFSLNGDATLPDDRDIPAIMRLLNAALPDSDPRKITREMVATIRGVTALGSMSGFENNSELVRLADALASYPPPEGT